MPPPLSAGPAAARAYGRIYPALRQADRQPRSRVADLMIAAVAVAEGLPLVTKNPGDFADLTDLVEIISLN